MLDGAYVTEITKACTSQLLLRKQEITWLFDKERNVSVRKKQKMVKIYFLKLLLIDFG